MRGSVQGFEGVLGLGPGVQEFGKAHRARWEDVRGLGTDEYGESTGVGMGCEGVWGQSRGSGLGLEGEVLGLVTLAKSLPQLEPHVVAGPGPRSNYPAGDPRAGAQKGKEGLQPPVPEVRLTLALYLPLQMAGMSPGCHLVPTEASCRAEDWFFWLFLGTEHQPQVPARAANCGGYLGEG